MFAVHVRIESDDNGDRYLLVGHCHTRGRNVRNTASDRTALQMINLDLGGNGDLHSVTEDVVNEAIHTLENPHQKVVDPSNETKA